MIEGLNKIKEFILDLSTPRRCAGCEKEGKYILALSRLHPIKGLDILVEAFSRIARHYECNLVIAKEHLQVYGEALNLDRDTK